VEAVLSNVYAHDHRVHQLAVCVAWGAQQASVVLPTRNPYDGHDTGGGGGVYGHGMRSGTPYLAVHHADADSPACPSSHGAGDKVRGAGTRC
jgi:hypothetical protein